MSNFGESIHFARQKYLAALPFEKTYRVGKYSATGVAKEKREVLLDLEGPGELRRLWSTHQNDVFVKIAIFVDGSATPVLEGMLHELAKSGEAICEPDLPLGGFYDRRSCNLYAPVFFERSLRIEAEPTGKTGDGPYWQIDYALGCEPSAPSRRVESRDGRLCALGAGSSDGERLANEGTLREMVEEFELTQCDPHDIRVAGPAVIRRIEIVSPALDQILLHIAFDAEHDDPSRLDGPFQVDAPLRYLVGNFANAGVERVENTATIFFPMPFRRRAAIQLAASIGQENFHQKYPVKIRIEYEPDPAAIERMFYFHAVFRSADTNGFDDLECCSTSGRGHFVGVHIFDTGHDHGGGDNMVFDAGTASAGQLHGICGEDYFHMAYMRTGNRSPYSGCPTHSARYRHHLEMPVPFQESFVFNWGSFAGQPAKAVALWYQDAPSRRIEGNELVWRITGPFPLEQLREITPGAPLPGVIRPYRENSAVPRPAAKTWKKIAQRGFVDLCHIHRKYQCAVPPSKGDIQANVCTVARCAIWMPQAAAVRLRIGCEDPIRVFLGEECLLDHPGRDGPMPFQSFEVEGNFRAGLNPVMVVVGNTVGGNWAWNGFSFVVKFPDKETEAFSLCPL